jgi:hypothetical protein
VPYSIQRAQRVEVIDLEEVVVTVRESWAESPWAIV